STSASPTKKRPTWPNTLHDRPAFSPSTRLSSTHTPTTGHPAVFVPQGPPGVSTEFMWECEYEKLPVSFFEEYFSGGEEEERYGETRDLMIEPQDTRYLYGGKRHFGEESDHVAALLGGVDLPLQKKESRDPEADSEVRKLHGLWNRVKEGTARVSDMKAEIRNWREMERERGAETAELLHRDKVAATGFGRVLKGQSVEPIRGPSRREGGGEVDPEVMEEYHRHRVADIGFGRVPRGGRMEPVDDP
ncbi:hypothetical protein HDU98_000354, partial [Podochytrium sp. JEL0797]